MKDDNRICADCVTEPYLRAEVARSGNVGKRCDYCGQKAPTFGMGEVAERCNRVIEMFYTLTSMTPAVVYFGRTPRGEGLLDIVGRWLTQEYDAPAYDLQEVLLARWDDGEGGKYGDEDPWFVRARASGWQLDAAWTRMERSLREEARLVNPVVVQTLEKVFSGLLDDRTQNGESVIIEIGPERPVDTLFRARVFETQESLEHALQHPERELGPPCPALATAGRMNARGVSVFYGAIEANTAIREVRPPVGSDVVVAAFKVLRPLRLLNLTALSHARADPSLSLFDPATTDIVERCDFLNTLEDILTMPIMPAFTEGGYLITQAVSDFLSTHPHLDLDGIYFRSVQSRGNASDIDGHNVILFHKAAAVAHANGGEELPTRAHVIERLSEDEWDGPCITTLEPPPDHSTLPSWNDNRQATPALELLRDSLVIHKVQGVKIVTISQKVEHKDKRVSVRG